MRTSRTARRVSTLGTKLAEDTLGECDQPLGRIPLRVGEHQLDRVLAHREQRVGEETVTPTQAFERHGVPTPATLYAELREAPVAA